MKMPANGDVGNRIFSRFALRANELIATGLAPVVNGLCASRMQGNS